MAREYAAWLKLIESATIRKQQVAFTCATGLPLTLLPATAGVCGSAADVPCAIHAPDVRRASKLADLGVGFVMTPKVDSLKVERTMLRDLGLLEPTP